MNSAPRLDEDRVRAAWSCLLGRHGSLPATHRPTTLLILLLFGGALCSRIPGGHPSASAAEPSAAEPSAAEPSSAAPLQRFQRSDPHMGTSFGIVFYARNAEVANRAFTAAFERIADLNRICSDYDSQSELSRLSAKAPTPEPVPISGDLYRVLAAAQELSARSEGAFDVTVGQLTRLWRRARLQKKIPPAEKVQEALETAGYQHLVLHAEGPAAELRRSGMRLDLGAIAKGYAVDEALRVLQQHGITRALINAGGNLAVGDPPPGASAWRIAIAPPKRGEPPSRAVFLANAGVATSGDTFQYLEADGRRYSHILDPRTGSGLTCRRSVTVIAPSGMAADGLATAVSVLGPEKGLQLIEQTPSAAAYLAEIAENGVTEYRSSRFVAYERAPESP